MTVDINGVRLPFDVLDAETSAAFCRGLERLGERLQAERWAGQPPAEVVAGQCRAVFELFNELFGEGTDRAVFGGRCNLRDALTALAELCEAAQKQQREGLFASPALRRYSFERADRAAGAEGAGAMGASPAL